MFFSLFSFSPFFYPDLLMHHSVLFLHFIYMHSISIYLALLSIYPSLPHVFCFRSIYLLCFYFYILALLFVYPSPLFLNPCSFICYLLLLSLSLSLSLYIYIYIYIYIVELIIFLHAGHPWITFYTDSPTRGISVSLIPGAPCFPQRDTLLKGESVDDHGLVDMLAVALSQVQISEPKRSRICPVRQEYSSTHKANLCAAF